MCKRLWDTSKIFKSSPVRSLGDKSVNLLLLILSLLSVVIPINDPPSDSNSLWSNFKCSIPVAGSLKIFKNNLIKCIKIPVPKRSCLIVK